VIFVPLFVQSIDLLPDGALNPPHFYITAEECQRALLFYTGMTQHPQIPEIERDRIREPAAPLVQPPAPPVIPEGKC
jgi:hypothetical protein